MLRSIVRPKWRRPIRLVREKDVPTAGSWIRKNSARHRLSEFLRIPLRLLSLPVAALVSCKRWIDRTVLLCRIYPIPRGWHSSGFSNPPEYHQRVGPRSEPASKFPFREAKRGNRLAGPSQHGRNNRHAPIRPVDSIFGVVLGHLKLTPSARKRKVSQPRYRATISTSAAMR